MKNALFYMFLTTQNALFYKFQDFRMPYFTYFRVFRTPYLTKRFIFNHSDMLPYHAEGKRLVKIGISFDSTQRTISDWKIKEE